MTRENKHQAFRVGSSLRLRLRFMALNLHFLPISTSETKENLNPPRSRQPPKEKRSAAVGSKSEQNIIFISHFHLASRIALSLSLSPFLALLLLAALHILLYQPGGTWSRPNGASQGRQRRLSLSLCKSASGCSCSDAGDRLSLNRMTQAANLCVCATTNDLGNELGQAQFNAL